MENSKNLGIWKYIPNTLTIFRILLSIAVFLLLIINPYNSKNLATISFNGKEINIYLSFIIAGSLFALASITDFIDGYIARKKHVISNFGKLMDPIADKILVNGTLIILTYWNIVYVWITVLIICRDLIVDGTRMVQAQKGIAVPANIWGKLKTVFEMLGILLILFLFNQVTNSDPFWLSNLVMIFALFFSLLSGVIYEYKMLKPQNKKKGN